MYIKNINNMKFSVRLRANYFAFAFLVGSHSTGHDPAKNAKSRF